MGGISDNKPKPKPKPVQQPKIAKQPDVVQRGQGTAFDARRRKSGTVLTDSRGLASTVGKSLLGA